MKVLMWARGDVEDTIEFPDDATEQDIQDAFQDVLGSIDSGWNVIEGEEPPSIPSVEDEASKKIVAALKILERVDADSFASQGPGHVLFVLRDAKRALS